jgi:hypothetical protein
VEIQDQGKGVTFALFVAQLFFTIQVPAKRRPYCLPHVNQTLLVGMAF